MLRIDGERGAMCDFKKEATKEALKDAVRRIERLQRWTNHAGLTTYIPQLLKWAKKGPHSVPAIFSVNEDGNIEETL